MEEGELPTRPWEVIATDVFVFSNELYLVMIDYYSRWIEAILIRSQTSGAVISAMRDIFAHLGIPKIIRSDNGPCYDSREFRKYASHSGFTSVTSSPRYPQSNGLAESAVKIVKSLWRKNSDKSSALFVYRTTPLRTGYSPSELMFGRPIRSLLGMPGINVIDYDVFEENERQYRDTIKSKWDKKYRVSKLMALKEGDVVWIKSPSDIGCKGVIVRKDSAPESYWVNVGNSELRRNRKHLSLLHAKGPCVTQEPNGDSESVQESEDGRESEFSADSEDPDGDSLEETGGGNGQLERGLMPEAGDDSSSGDSGEARGRAPQLLPGETITRSGRRSRRRKEPNMVYY